MQRLLWILLLGLTGAACGSLRSKSDSDELGQHYVVVGGQPVFFRDSTGAVETRTLTRATTAVLYEDRDTLFVDFAESDLPPLDSLVSTLDRGDANRSFFAHHDRRSTDAPNRTDWFLFHYMSFDVDLITIPFKYRTGQADNAGEFITTTNIGVYLGVRYDYDGHRIHYFREATKSEISGISFGGGLFLDLNDVGVTPYSTNNAIDYEYDALGFNYGISGIFGYRSFTLGLALGFETLLDKNAALWIYNHKPWLGITIGLNLN